MFQSPEKTENSRRLEEFSRLMLFETVDEVFKLFKQNFDNEAKFYRDRLPLNEKSTNKSYIAHWETNDEVVTRIYWVAKADEKHLVEITSFKHNNDTADQHGEEKA